MLKAGVKSALLMALLAYGFSSPSAAQSLPDAPSEPNRDQQAVSVRQRQLEIMEEEVGEHDISHVRSRLVFRYDYQSQEGNINVNRFRLKSVFAFGPQHRLAVSINLPVIYKQVPGDSAWGAGDVDLAFGGYLFGRERFRSGALVEVKVQSSTDQLLGGSTTTIKPAWGFVAVLNSHTELTSVFNYKRSIRTTRGNPSNEFEPDITLSTRRWNMSWWVEWDSYYLITPEHFAQTLKVGASRVFGRERCWVVSPYYSFPLNASGRQTQYIHQVGADVIWYLPKK